MSNYLDLEPGELRRMAAQHGAAAARVREWGKIPRGWLDDFRRTHGTIAEPMREALEDYYQRRHDRAERQAADHERTRDNLLTAAKAMEEADHHSGSGVSAAGTFDGITPGRVDGPGATIAPAPAVFPAGQSTAFPNAGATVSSGPATVGARPAVPSEGASGQSPVSAPRGSGVSPVPGVTGRSSLVSSSRSSPRTVDAPSRATAPVDVPPPSATASSAVDRTNAAAGTAATASPVKPVEATVSASAATSATNSVERSGGRVAGPLARGPFLSATATGRAAPPLVVGDTTEDDLSLACALLSSVLAAVADSEPGLEWAVAVMRFRRRPVVVLNSTEGLGWLPSGLFLPMEVTVPSKWREIFEGAGEEAFAAAEGASDPTRVFAEWISVLRRKRMVRISAIASSAIISDTVRGALGARTAVADEIGAAESALDLTTPGTGLVDRLQAGGSHHLLEQAEAVADTDIRSTCLALAAEAHMRVRDLGAESDGWFQEQAEDRQRILDTLRMGGALLPSWLDQMRAADAMSAAVQRSRRVDVSNVPIGHRPNMQGLDDLRRMFFERRADEIFMLLAAGEPDRQTLRDVFYAYGQIAEDPNLPASSVPIVADTGLQSAGSGGVIAVAPPPVTSTTSPPISTGGSRTADMPELSTGSKLQRST